MNGSGDNSCVDPLRFPAPIFNRPGLPRIGYRIGAYASIRQAMMRKLDLAPELAAWTYRAADDPGIALLEGAAIVGDILTLYQEVYANEAYLRTAQWRESVAELVRLTAYRLSPGLAGRADFAFEVRGTTTVTVPAGFPLTAQVTGVEGTADWETGQELIAYPALSRFSLYRPFAVPSLGPATPELRVVGPDPDVPAVPLIAGDRILLGTPTPGTSPNRLTSAEIVVIDSVRMLHGRPLYRIRGALTRTPAAGAVVGYKLGRSFRHFGYNAPPTKTVVTSGVASQQTIGYTRPFHAVEASNITPAVGSAELPLDAEVDDLARGGVFVVQTREAISQLTLLRTAKDIRAGSYTWGVLTGGSTVLTLGAELDSAATVPGSSTATDVFDIRDVAVHETLGPLLTFAAAEAATTDATGTTLNFLGTAAEAAALAGRKLVLEGVEDEPIFAGVSAVATPPAGQDARRILRSLSLDRDVPYARFPLENPIVIAYGNIVEATQGKSERMTVLGSGDARATFQTFALPKAPLSYLISEGATPPEVPELEVYVSGRKWTRVSTFFNRTASEEVYIVREDAEGKSWVQFGDGKTGARLPSGAANVTALFRAGSGAFGTLVTDTSVSAGAKLERLDKIRLPGVASGGTEPESAGNARAAAPGKVQSLDRLVSLADFEAEALAIAGVWRVAARWALHAGVPTLLLTILMESGRAGELSAVRDTIAGYDRCRGMQRFPIVVEEGQLLPVFVNASFAFDPHYIEADVRAAIEVALGTSTAEEGLFWPGRRRFGAAEYATRVEGAIQNVDGVIWAKVTAVGVVGGPAAGDGVILCPGNCILSLAAAQLQLAAVIVPGEECAT